MNVPEFIVERVLLSTLMLDKGVSFGSIKERFPILRESITEYFDSIDSGFVSNNSSEFKEYLEERVGKVEFAKSFAVRIRPGSYRLFVGGNEILP